MERIETDFFQKTTIKTIAIDGVCNFCCHMCEIDGQCSEYNHQKESDLDQKEFRKRVAGEYLMRNNK